MVGSEIGSTKGNVDRRGMYDKCDRIPIAHCLKGRPSIKRIIYDKVIPYIEMLRYFLTTEAYSSARSHARYNLLEDEIERDTQAI